MHGDQIAVRSKRTTLSKRSDRPSCNMIQRRRIDHAWTRWIVALSRRSLFARLGEWALAQQRLHSNVLCRSSSEVSNALRTARTSSSFSKHATIVGRGFRGGRLRA